MHPNWNEFAILNIFYLDENLEKNAEYHVDSHVVKMPTEVAQMMTTAVWVDKLIGYVPRKLTSEELKVLNEFKATQPPIEERTFTRFLPAHPNHPCTVWIRSSLDNYEWAFGYLSSLNDEYKYRYKPVDHKSYLAGLGLPDITRMPSIGLTERPQAMPEDYQVEGNALDAYRMYYMMEKANFAVWKRREKPPWWDDYLVEYSGSDPHESYLKTIRAEVNKNKPHSQEYKINVCS